MSFPKYLFVGVNAFRRGLSFYWNPRTDTTCYALQCNRLFVVPNLHRKVFENMAENDSGEQQQKPRKYENDTNETSKHNDMKSFLMVYTFLFNK